ncbi:unnamed protein product, partial [Didymodactylos carnosus]
MLSNQPIKLYEKIRLVHMHVVPKSVKISTTAEYEFRYSFSAIERLLAQSRTSKQRILNETYTTETLDETCKILENIDLFEINQTPLKRTPYDIATNCSEDIKQWIGKLNLKDVQNAIHDFTNWKLQLFSQPLFVRNAIYEIIIVLNALTLLDGDREENNLSVWKRLFLDTDNDEREDGNIENRRSEWSMLHPSHIIDGLSSAAIFMKWMKDIVTSASNLNSIKNSTLDLFIRVLHIMNKTKIFKLNKGERISLFLPNDVNPYYQQTPTSPSIIDDSHANGGTQLINLIKK